MPENVQEKMPPQPTSKEVAQDNNIMLLLAATLPKNNKDFITIRITAVLNHKEYLIKCILKMNN